MSKNPARKVSIGAHPTNVVVLSVAGIIASIIVLAHATPRDLSVALLIGLGVGLPTVFIEKWILRRFRDFYAEFYTSPWEERASWRMQKTNWLCSSVMLAAMLLISILEVHAGLHGVPGVAIFLALHILAYPEQKAIYEAAKAKLREV